jgi:hypothetical protein
MQEQVNERTVALSVKGAKLTAHLLAKAMRAFVNKAREPPAKGTKATGLQSVKSLTKQGNSLANIEITGENIGVFKRTARKYNIDFSLKKDNSENPPKWIVFFKSKDADSMTAAFKDFSAVILKQKQKPSLVGKLNRLKEFVKTVAAPAKKHHRGEQSR